jgi:hypothetical protein
MTMSTLIKEPRTEDFSDTDERRSEEKQSNCTSVL